MDGSMALDGLDGVGGAGRDETAGGPAKKNGAGRRQHPAVEMQGGEEDVSDEIHADSGASKPARVRARAKSLATHNWHPLEMLGRAMNTKWAGASNRSCNRRKASRIQRRARLRCTALPTDLEVMIPTCHGWPAGSRLQFRTTVPLGSRSPLSRTA